tara:strand:- start:1736 stop:3958 length:2223 start_codon:yes stop_codon:yes gene_type:complete
MPSIIKIRITQQPVQDNSLVLHSTFGIVEVFKYIRTSSRQSVIGNINPNETLSNLEIAFNTDFNNSGVFTTSINPLIPPGSLWRELSIEHPDENYFTSSTFSQNGTAFTVAFENTPSEQALAIDSVTFLSSSLVSQYIDRVEADGGTIEASDCLFAEFPNTVTSCRYVNISVTTSEQVDSYVLGTDNTPVNVSTNPFYIDDVLRDTTFKLFVIADSSINLVPKYTTRVGEDGGVIEASNCLLAEFPNTITTEASVKFRTPDRLVNDNVTSTYVNSPSGATITILVSDSELLVLKYSLDGTNFQLSNVFSGILQGDYNIYVKDQLGCLVDTTITIPSFEEGGVGERFPYSDLPSKSNSIRFAKYLDWGNCSNYKNDENTLSWQLPFTENACEYNQLFQDCDIITTQIKSNYKNIVVTVIDENEVETNISVTQKSNYISLKDSREARVYNLANLGIQTGMYFTSGSTYDYYTGDVTGSYSLNGNLPAWGVIGNYVFYDSAWFQISNIIYDDSKSAYVLVLDVNYTGAEQSLRVNSLYNLEDYDIYEFNIDMSDFTDKKIQVNITQTDDNVSFPTEVYLSEVLDIAETQEGTLSIEYYNDNNTDIFYATGIKNKVRIPIEYFAGGYSDNVESERTDSNTYLINSEGYENDLIAFKLMPKQIMRKVIQALSHKFVFLNEVQYVKEESPEITPLIGSNLYRVNAQMTKSNAVYTAQGKNETFSLGAFEVPSLLEIETEGYLKIKN